VSVAEIVTVSVHACSEFGDKPLPASPPRLLEVIVPGLVEVAAPGALLVVISMYILLAVLVPSTSKLAGRITLIRVSIASILDIKT
jgi:hypothetical protein